MLIEEHSIHHNQRSLQQQAQTVNCCWLIKQLQLNAMPSSKSTSSSRRVKHPETHKQRRPDLPRSNPIEKTSKILAPELPGQFITKRSSIRSHLTAVTHDSHSTAASEQSHIVARKIEDGFETPPEPRSSFFIPGITGKARCLDASGNANANGSPLRSRSHKLMEEAESSLGESRGSHHTASRKSEASRGSRGSRKSGSHKSHHSAADGSSASSSEPNLDQAHQLYDAVIDSIHSRREEGTNDLDEDEFQRMVKLLENDVEKLELEDETSGLREQVTSIQNLLSDYERKKRRKQASKKKKRPSQA